MPWIALNANKMMCGVSEFNVGQIQSQGENLSVRFIFRISEVRDQPDGFSWLVKNRLTAVQLKTLNSLMCFSQVQNCWRWLSLIRSSSSTKKETQTKIYSSSVSCAGFALLSADLSSLKSNSSSSAHWKLVSYGLRWQWSLFSWGLLQIL